MNLPPYPNLRKAERIKSTLRILQEDFYSVYLTHQLLQIAEKVCTLRSLIDWGCRVLIRWLEKIATTNCRGGWNSREDWEKVKILIAKGIVSF